MIRWTGLFMVAALLCAPARAQNAVDRERVSVTGWAKACSVAVEYFGYPAGGSALFAEPVSVKIGTLRIVEPKTRLQENWLVQEEGKYAWNADQAAKARRDLKRAGYTMAGSSETVWAQPSGWPEVDEVLFTTKALGAYSPGGWPPPDFKLDRIHYSPMGSCALLVYRWSGSTERDFFHLALVQVRNPRAQVARFEAHLAMAIRLFNERGDLERALAEAAIAAAGSPRNHETRYRYAAFLALSGYPEPALDELSAAIRLEPKDRERAAKDIDFDNLKKDKRFRHLTR